MKLTTAFLALMTMVSTAAAATISSKTAEKLVRRRLDEEEEEEEYAFLGNYDVKLVGCKTELEQPIMNEQGEYEYSAVLLRLCPASEGCDSATESGCDSGYGEMLVGMSTFVEAYFEDQRENMEEEDGDDNFEVDKFAKCEEYDPDENADDANQGAWENYEFFVGPTCTEDELGLKLELFTDQYCTQVSETSFETISNGWTLPYSSGGLVSTYCSSCTEYDDDGEMEIRELCMQSYEDAAYKCEESMEYYSYYGQNNQGCETLAEMFPMAKSSSGGKIFGWIVLAVVVVGLVFYVIWWRQKKSASMEN